MRIQITDDKVFNSIEPLLAEKYLQANGWKEQHRLESDVSIWFSDRFADKTYRLWLPFRSTLPDYGQIMGRAVRVIAEAENKSELQVLEDLNTVAVGDVIRLVDYDPLNRESGTLPLSEGEYLIRQGKELTIAAAMSVSQPRAVHPTSRNKPVREFVDNLRLAQSEYGSYTIKIISPIKPEDLEIKKTAETQIQLIETPPKPFGRQAVEKLITSLGVLREIGKEAHKKGTYYFQPFMESISQGISANLCEAVTSNNGNGQNKPLHISVTWSSMLPKPEDISATAEVEIPVDYMGYYKTAAEEFRRKNPEPKGISGYVRVLRREKGVSEGVISVVTVINNVQGVVKVELRGNDYSAAVHAHDEELFVTIEGELIKKGRFSWLNNPRNIQVSESPELPLEGLT